MQEHSLPAVKTASKLSVVMPCYNEEAIIGFTIPAFVRAFEDAGYQLELITVDNGSTDRTPDMLREFAELYPSVVYHRVEVNQGYGHGILDGSRIATGDWISMIPADGQVDPEDVVKLYEAVLSSDGKVLGKVRRRFRMDGMARKVVSIIFNTFMRILWPSMESVDVNGTPKMLRTELFRALDLQSKNWLLDVEMMIKAHYLGIHIMELNVFARMRGNGLSHIKAETCWEFIKYILKFRFSPEMNRWKKSELSALIGANGNKGAG